MKKLSKKQRRKLMKKAYKNRKYLPNGLIIMTMPVAVRTITATISFPKGILKRGARASAIIKACTGNAHVSVSAAKISRYKSNVANYLASDRAGRDMLWLLVKNDMDYLKGLFQAAANDDYENAVEIILSGGFKVKKITLNQKRKLKLTNNVTNGCIDAKTKGGGQRTCHDWWVSVDGVTFVRHTPTIAGYTTMKKLEEGKYAYVMHQLITKDGPQGLSQIHKILVK